ncbi:CiaD-like domain-containing protein [Sulfurimonas sp.]|uniref:CiaD-like domain-containing protein n=1 Tax=Sulfurimonas sp. TaxID=2022749 RepID=UPI003D101DC3
MELKDVILSTLAEMEEELPPVDTKQEEKAHTTFNEPTTSTVATASHNNSVDNELYFLKSIRERLLVLFEGFQAPNNSNIEAKIDMTLNFLEYTLATIDERVKVLEKDKI